ncbi:hypothetical protein D3C86_2146170 [compost metagenome]
MLDRKVAVQKRTLVPEHTVYYTPRFVPRQVDDFQFIRFEDLNQVSALSGLCLR